MSTRWPYAVVACLALGCATDPPLRAMHGKPAHDPWRDYYEHQAELHRSQGQDRAELGRAQPSDRAAASAEQREQTAQVETERADARADVMRERQQFVEALRERLDRVDRSLRQMVPRPDTASAKTRGDAAAQLPPLREQLEAVVRRLDAFPRVADTDWPAEERALEQQVAALEAQLKTLLVLP